MRTTFRSASAAAVLLALASTAVAQQQYFATDRFTGTVYRLADINGDGDALDAGERVLWGDGLSNAAELARYKSGLLVVDSVAARVRYYVDNNGDGDALDAGESVIWADGMTSPFGIATGPGGQVFLSDFVTNQVFRAVDTNGDGDALDAGERLLYADGMAGPVSMMAQRNSQFVVAYNSSVVHRLQDANGDGDALDAGENLVHTPATLLQVEGILAQPGGGYIAGSWTNDALYRVRDVNGDGDALDAAEVVTWADGLAAPVAVVPGLGPGPADRMITIQAATGTLDPAAPKFVAIVEGSTLKAGAVATRLNAGTSVLISTDAPATFATGNILQQAGAVIAKTAGGAATLTMRADDSIELAGGISSSAGALAVVLVANDAALAYRDNDTAAGNVVISAPINTAGGGFTTSGVNFNNTGGAVTAGAVTMNHTGSVTIGAVLSATSLNVSASGGVQIATTGRLAGGGSIVGAVNNSGVLAPGAPTTALTVTGAFAQAVVGKLEIEIGGTAAGLFDRLDVTGTATLAGTLDVNLTGGFSPALGDRFTVLTFASRSGNFGTYQDVNLGGHKLLKPLFNATSLKLRAAPTQDGDVNLDGLVDISDVQNVAAHWLTTSPLGDANLDDFVDISDIQTIAAHYLQSGGGTGVARVPEPSTMVLALLGLVAVACGTRRLAPAS